MSNAKFCVSWLQGNYEENDTEEVTLHAMHANYKDNGGTLSKPTFGKYIQSFFPKAAVYKKWYPSDKKEMCVYKGLGEKIPYPESELEFSSISHWVPSPYFVCKNDSDKIQYGLFSDVVNRNSIVKKVTFNINREWQLHVGETEIDLNEIGIENSFKITINSINGITSIVSKLILCTGKEKGLRNIKISKGIITELYGEENKEIYRYINCKRIIPFSAYARTCRKCQYMIKFTKNSDVGEY